MKSNIAHDGSSLFGQTHAIQEANYTAPAAVLAPAGGLESREGEAGGRGVRGPPGVIP